MEVGRQLVGIGLFSYGLHVSKIRLPGLVASDFTCSLASIGIGSQFALFLSCCLNSHQCPSPWEGNNT